MKSDTTHASNKIRTREEISNFVKKKKNVMEKIKNIVEQDIEKVYTRRVEGKFSIHSVVMIVKTKKKIYIYTHKYVRQVLQGNFFFLRVK